MPGHGTNKRRDESCVSTSGGAIDCLVNVHLSDQVPPPWMVRVKEDYFKTDSMFETVELDALIERFGQATGVPVVLNTSFNLKGEPIVNTPAEAIETFLGTGIQALFLENALVRKRSTA